MKTAVYWFSPLFLQCLSFHRRPSTSPLEWFLLSSSMTWLLSFTTAFKSSSDLSSLQNLTNTPYLLNEFHTPLHIWLSNSFFFLFYLLFLLNSGVSPVFSLFSLGDLTTSNGIISQLTLILRLIPWTSISLLSSTHPSWYLLGVWKA